MKEKTTITSVSFDKDSIKIRIGGHTAVIAPDKAFSLSIELLNAYEGWLRLSKSPSRSVLHCKSVHPGKTDSGDFALVFRTEAGVPLVISLPRQCNKSLERSLKAAREL